MRATVGGRSRLRAVVTPPPAHAPRPRAAAAARCAGCGNKVEVRTVGETEGIYIDVGDLRYQVQISRIINPHDVEDRRYLQGLPAGTLAAEGRRGVVRRLAAGPEHDRSETTLAAADGVRDRRHAGEHVRADRARGEPVRLRGAGRSGPTAVLPNSESPAGEGADPGLADPVQAHQRGARRTGRSSSRSQSPATARRRRHRRPRRLASSPA